MKPNSNHLETESKIEKIIRIGLLWSLILGFVTIVYWASFYKPNQLEKNHRYTVGRIFRLRSTAELGMVADFDYYVGKKKYSGSFTLEYVKETTQQVGERYYLKFYPPDPENCYILLEKTVPDSLKEIPLNDEMIPTEGWKTIP